MEARTPLRLFGPTEGKQMQNLNENQNSAPDSSEKITTRAGTSHFSIDEARRLADRRGRC